MDPHELLGVDAEDEARILDSFQQRSYEGREYRHLPDARHGIEKGTVLVGETAVRGFPKIPRTLVLETGVPRQFDGRVAVEEKLNGYNVRVARVDGDLLAFTRSGYVCPFTTRRLASLLDLGPFFDAHPDAMLCGEMVGPENPYTDHPYEDVDSIAFRVFDVRDRESGTPLPVEVRRERCEAFDLPQVSLLGVYDAEEAAQPIREHIESLDAAGREGVVMKSMDGRTQLKYTTSAANQGALEFAFSLPFDYGQEFMFRRIIREAFQSVEWDEDPETARERAHSLGEAILLSAIDAVETVEAGGSVGERHTVRADPEAVDALLAHLDDQGLTLDVESDETRDGERVVTFEKVAASTRDKIRSYLDGQPIQQ